MGKMKLYLFSGLLLAEIAAILHHVSPDPAPPVLSTVILSLFLTAMILDVLAAMRSIAVGLKTLPLKFIFYGWLLLADMAALATLGEIRIMLDSVLTVLWLWLFTKAWKNCPNV